MLSLKINELDPVTSPMPWVIIIIIIMIIISLPWIFVFITI